MEKNPPGLDECFKPKDVTSDVPKMSSLKFEDSHISVSVEKCLLCCGQNKNFHCMQCLRSGRFIYSNKKLQQLNNTWKDKYRGRLANCLL